jgi:hypothetical protein
VIADKLPDEQPLLPTVGRLREVVEGRATTADDEMAGQDADDEAGCTVARLREGYRESPPEPDSDPLSTLRAAFPVADEWESWPGEF